MQWTNPFFNWYFDRRNKRIREAISNPLQTQLQTFQYLIQKGRDTEWGKNHDFQSIHNIDDFRRKVPTGVYEDLQPYIKRMLAGEQNVLWPTPVNWFAKSSGTTQDKSKFIPVSRESLHDCHYRGGKDLYALYAENFRNNRLFRGKGLIMGGSHSVNSENKNAHHGDLSAVLVANAPWWAHMKRVPSYETTLMEDWEEKIDAIARESVNEDVTHILGVPTWTVVLIQRLFEITGKDNLADIWPNLELYIHGGVSFTPYRDLFNRLIRKDNMDYLETYNASEGFFAMQDRPGSQEMLLMTDYGIFYEFLPIEKLDDPEPETLTLDQVETDRNYAIIISTNAGLWRYMIGDTIRFTSLNPFRIQVTGRTRHFINAFGEELIVENVENALAKACSETNARINDYTGAPVYLDGKSKGCHEYLIEFSIQPESMEKFEEVFDSELQKLNSDYEAKRYKNMALQKPMIKPLKPGSFYEWMKKRGKLGGQNKVPRLSNDRKYIDDLLQA